MGRMAEAPVDASAVPPNAAIAARARVEERFNMKLSVGLACELCWFGSIRLLVGSPRDEVHASSRIGARSDNPPRPYLPPSRLEAGRPCWRSCPAVIDTFDSTGRSGHRCCNSRQARRPRQDDTWPRKILAAEDLGRGIRRPGSPEG